MDLTFPYKDTQKSDLLQEIFGKYWERGRLARNYYLHATETVAFPGKMLFLQLEDLFDSFIEGTSDANGQRQARGVTALFSGDDRLARDADFVGQLLLGHLPGVKP